ncbi:MAG: FAD synthetase family protein [Spirochaetales bacterium]|nr:FAD synthetase family protein [Spirochaetales bacterium]
MRILEWSGVQGGSTDPLPPAAATIGVFDGLHLGHQALVSRVVAKAPQLTPMAVTFRENPKKTTRPQRYAGDIFSLEQKLSVLEEAGVELCVLIDFSGNFSKLTGKEFVSSLVQYFGVRYFVVGSDFKCGHRLSSDAVAVKVIAGVLGSETEIVEPVTVEGDKVSSSRIRSAIANGRTDQALAMLGRPYTLDLRRIGTVLKDATVGVSLRGKGIVEPAPGTYEATVVSIAGQLPVEARVSADGTLSWSRTSDVLDVEPAFLAFGPKIA